MKHYVLVYVEGYKGEESKANAAFQGFEDATRRLASTSKTSIRLGPRAWLFDRENDVALLAGVVGAAEDSALKYEVLFLTED